MFGGADTGLYLVSCIVHSFCEGLHSELHQKHKKQRFEAKQLKWVSNDVQTVFIFLIVILYKDNHNKCVFDQCSSESLEHLNCTYVECESWEEKEPIRSFNPELNGIMMIINQYYCREHPESTITIEHLIQEISEKVGGLLLKNKIQTRNEGTVILYQIRLELYNIK